MSNRRQSDPNQESTIFAPGLSAVKWNIAEDPFVYGYADDFLPTDLYESLKAEFPDFDSFDEFETLRKGKRRRRVEMNAELPSGLSAAWRAFIEDLRSPDFLSDCRQWIEPWMSAARPSSSHPWWFKCLGGRPGLRQWDVDLECQFSTFSSGNSLTPHTDSTDKVLAFILYFADHDWRPEWRGGTIIYRPVQTRHNANWSNRRLKPHQVTPECEITFRANRLVFFVKSSNSWHGVAPVNCPEDVIRKSFNFHITIPQKYRKPSRYRFTEKLIKWYDRRQFK